MNVYKVVYTVSSDDMYAWNHVFESSKELRYQDLAQALDRAVPNPDRHRGISAALTDYQVMWIAAISVLDAVESMKEIMAMQEPNEQYEIVEVSIVVPHLLCSPRHSDSLSVDRDGWLQPSQNWD